MPPAQPSPDANAPNVATMQVTRTERGWAAHYRGARYCLFRRNTLLECGTARIVVSTVGAYVGGPGALEPINDGPGGGAYYETKAFHATQVGPYLEADTCREIPFTSPWGLCATSVSAIPLDADNLADAQHERVVAELMARMAGQKEGATIMKVWTNNQFEGKYPVGTAAVVVAETAQEAAELLTTELTKRGIPSPVTAEQFELLSPRHRGVRVLCDGDY